MNHLRTGVWPAAAISMLGMILAACLRSSPVHTSSSNVLNRKIDELEEIFCIGVWSTSLLALGQVITGSIRPQASRRRGGDKRA